MNEVWAIIYLENDEPKIRIKLFNNPLSTYAYYLHIYSTHEGEIRIERHEVDNAFWLEYM